MTNSVENSCTLQTDRELLIEALVRDFKPQVLTFIRRYLPSYLHDGVEDIFQEALLACYKHPHLQKEGSTPQSLLFGIARYQAFRFVKTQIKYDNALAN